jgi:hypothetical protein
MPDLERSSSLLGSQLAACSGSLAISLPESCHFRSKPLQVLDRSTFFCARCTRFGTQASHSAACPPDSFLSLCSKTRGKESLSGNLLAIAFSPVGRRFTFS